MRDAAAPPRLGRVAIVGGGQVGTMLGLVLREAASEVVLADRDYSAAEASVGRGAADRVIDIEEATDGDEVVLAVPVPEIVGLIQQLGPKLRAGSLLIDTGSAKGVVVDAMRRHVPTKVHAIGGHPLAGTEHRGAGGARPEALKGAVFALTPVREDPEALARGRSLAEAAGARPVVIEADLHDRVVAVTSHAPHLLAAAVAMAARDLPLQVVRNLAASGFAGMTRLAESDPDMVAGFLSANAAEVRKALRGLRTSIGRAEAALGDTEALRAMLTDAADVRRKVRG